MTETAVTETYESLFSDLEAERAILSAILSDGQLIDAAMDFLSNEYFFHPKHRAIFRAMETLAGRHIVVDKDAVISVLGESGDPERVCDADDLAGLVNPLPVLDSSDFEVIADRIASKARDRSVLSLLQLVPEIGDHFARDGEKPEDISLDGFTISDGVTTEKFTVELPLEGTLPKGRRYAIPKPGFEDPVSQNSYRRDYMKLVSEMAPEVLRTLLSGVFPKYLCVGRTCPVISDHLADFVAKADGIQGFRTEILGLAFRASGLEPPGSTAFGARTAITFAPGPSSILDFIDSITEWGQQYGLNERWMIEEYALPTLKWWALTGHFTADEDSPSLIWHSHITIAPFDLESAFRFEFPRWRPEADDSGAYKTRIGKAFEARLEAYLDKKVVEARQTGREPIKRVDKRRHWKYLVQYQVKKMERREIYDLAFNGELDSHEVSGRNGETDKPLDDSTVNKAIKTAAELLGITLRASETKPGPRRE